MSERKQILLDIQTNYQQATKDIAKYTTEISKLKDEEKELKKAMDMLRAANQTETEQYQELANRLAANTESQKAYRKEIQEVSRSVQNSIIAEGKYKDTLKGKAAQLSIEKDKLRAIKIAYGELSAEYKAQEQIVADLNAEVMALERAYGTHTRNVGNYESAWNGALSRIKALWVALIAAVVKGLKDFGDSFIKTTQKIGDRWDMEVAGWKDAYTAFIRSLQRGDGWNDLIENIRTAYTEGKRFTDMLDEITERENSLRIEEAQMAAENEQLKITMRDRTKSDEERLAAAQKVLENEEHLAEVRQDIANQELEANKGRLQQQAKMSDEELEYYVQQYNRNKDIIRQALEYNEAIRQQQLLITKARAEQRKQAGRDIAARGGMAGAGSTTGTVVTQTEKDAQAEIARLTAAASDGLKEVAAIAAKYEMTNDELVTRYVESYIKAETVRSDMIQHTAKAQIQMHNMEAELAADAQKSAEQAAAERKKRTEEEQRRTEEALKAEERAMQQYAETVSALFERLTEQDGVDAEIRKIEQDYRQLTADLKVQVQQGNITFEEATYYRVMLAQKEAAEIKAVREKAADEERQRQEQEVAEQARRRQEQVKTDLQVAWQNADEQFRIKRDYLMKELEVEELAAGRRAELEQQLTELFEKETQRKMDIVMDYTGKAADLLQNTGQVLTNLGQQEVQDAEARNEKEKDTLDKRLNAGLISQRQYDQKVKQMDRELDAEKAALARKQAIRERASSLFSVAMSTAQAIMKVWAEVPVYVAPVMTALVAANGLAQTAAILSEPLPKARRGGQVQGPSHDGGGVLIETEGGERIVAQQPSRAFPELLNLISYVGKHGGVPQTGYDVRNGIGGADVDYERMKEAMKEAVAEVKVWLSLTELRDAEDTQVNIEQLARQ